jgi:hypothetical protein
MRVRAGERRPAPACARVVQNEKDQKYETDFAKKKTWGDEADFRQYVVKKKKKKKKSVLS